MIGAASVPARIASCRCETAVELPHVGWPGPDLGRGLVRVQTLDHARVADALGQELDGALLGGRRVREAPLLGQEARELRRCASSRGGRDELEQLRALAEVLAAAEDRRRSVTLDELRANHGRRPDAAEAA
jgi:hypothetical protein